MTVKDGWETIDVDDESYSWQTRHGWLVDAGRGLKGVSIVVVHEPGRTREVVIDFPFSFFGRDRSPAVAEILVRLRPAIRRAIAAGWRPDSRGRAFRFAWTEPPPT
jgi:hypothetical protein